MQEALLKTRGMFDERKGEKVAKADDYRKMKESVEYQLRAGSRHIEFKRESEVMQNADCAGRNL